MKKLSILLLTLILSSCFHVEDVGVDLLNDDETIFTKYEYSYLGLENQDVDGDWYGIWKGTMREFINSPLFKSGKEYQISIFDGFTCSEDTGWCEEYEYCCTYIVTIP